MDSNNSREINNISSLPNDWELLELGSILSFITDGVHNPPKRTTNGIKFIAGATNIKYLNVDFTNCTYISKEDYDKIHKFYSIEPNDILLTIVGTVGNVAIVKENDLPFSIQRSIALLRSGPLLYYRFLFYWLNSPEFKKVVYSYVNSTAQPGVYLGVIKQFKMPVPKLSEQKAIAKILSGLDSKIELNQKMNETLESIAQAIFKHWFIDFEFPNEEGKPYKSGGGEMVDSELGKIPKGWKVDKLSKIANVIDCLHSKKPNFVKSQNFILQLYNFNEIHSIDLSDPYTVSDGDFHMWTRNITVKYGDILVSNAAKVGAISQVPEWFVGGIGRNITTIRAQGIGEYFLLYYLTSPLGTNQISMNTDVGTLFNSLNVKGIRLLRVLIPNSDLMKRSNFIFNSLRRKIETNLLENTFLKSTRDLLLPKLMAGKIRISAKVKENE